jgi:RimJ/RimL family protein N-acetyltransferase
MPSFPALPEPLRDDRVALRYAAERDIPEILIAHDDDPHLYVLVGRERPPTGAELGRRAENEPAERAAGTGARFTIVEPGSEAFLGQLSVHHVDWEQSRAELGVWLTPQARGRGLCARALRLLGAWLITTCGFERVQVFTDPNNAAMIGAARAAGYQSEGVLRSYQLLARGRRVDSAVFSLVRADVRHCTRG